MRRNVLALAVLVMLLGSLPAQVFKDHRQFMGAFSAAVMKDDYDAMAKLVEQNTKELLWFAFQAYEVSWCRQSLKEGAEEEERLAKHSQIIEMLGAMNRQKHKDTMLRDRWVWLQSLNKEQKQAKIDLDLAIAKGNPLFNKARKSRTAAAAKGCIPHFELALAESTKAGDAFWQANTCYYLAYLFDFQIKYFESCYYYKKGDEIGRNSGFARAKIEEFKLGDRLIKAAEKGRLKIEFIDTALPAAESQVKYKERLQKALDAPIIVDADSPGEKGTKGAKGAKTGKSIAALLGRPPTNHAGANMEWQESKGFKVKKLSKPADFWTTLDSGNGDWWNWKFIPVKKGTKVRFPFLPGKVQVENDSGKLFLHREGKKKERLKIKAKPNVTEFKKVSYLDGSVSKIYQCLMQRPSNYKVMGLPLRLPGDVIVLMCKGASSVTGKLRGVPFAIHDSNCNGAFNDWGADTIIIGKGKMATMVPLSRYVNLNGLMYELKVNANGKSVRTKPWDGDMAPLQVKFASNLTPKFLIAQGTGGDATYFINLLEAVDKPIWVVPGNLQFSHGSLADGTGLKAKSIRISKGRSGVFNAQVGQLNTWTLGGAGDGFTFGFKTETRRRKGQDYVVLTGKTIKVYGAFGEEYSQFLTGHVLPDVALRKGKDGATWARKSMRKPEREDINIDTNLAWYPKTLQIKKTSSGEYSVQLTANYEPLGKITSTWQTGE